MVNHDMQHQMTVSDMQKPHQERNQHRTATASPNYHPQVCQVNNSASSAQCSCPAVTPGQISEGRDVCMGP